MDIDLDYILRDYIQDNESFSNVFYDANLHEVRRAFRYALYKS